MSESIEEIPKKEDRKNVCKKSLSSFHTLRGLNQHLRTCSKLIEEPKEPPDPPRKEGKDSSPPLRYTWGSIPNYTFEKQINETYEKIIYWWRNLFMVPTGKASKEFINEITRLLNAWIDDSSLKDIAFKDIMVFPSLLSQEPNKKSKKKDHCAALQHRLTL